MDEIQKVANDFMTKINEGQLAPRVMKGKEIRCTGCNQVVPYSWYSLCGCKDWSNLV